MEISTSNPAQIAAIRAVHEQAFGRQEGPVIAQLVADMMSYDSDQPLLSLVAIDKQAVVGSVLFSPISISNNPNIHAYILCPLAVASHCQRAGLGTELIKQGLARLAKSGVDLVMVLGDPKFYAKSGFVSNHRIEAPYPIDYPEAWQAIALTKNILNDVAGTAHCIAPLNSQEHW